MINNDNIVKIVNFPVAQVANTENKIAVFQVELLEIQNGVCWNGVSDFHICLRGST